MRIAAPADMSDLADIAQRGGDEIRPLLLKVHTQAVVASPRRSRAMMDEYEALALGLLPLVPDDVVAETQAMLRNVPETPTRLVSAMRNRLVRPGAAAVDEPAAAIARAELDPHAVNELVLRGDPEVDLALAANRMIRLDGHALARLVERAQHDRALAVALLDRPEPTLFDRVALYGFCDEAARDTIRLDIAARLSPASVALPAIDPVLRDGVIAAAEDEDRATLFSLLARTLDLAPGWTCDLADPGGRELFVLALQAAGLSVPDCMRVVLMIDARMARSVGSVFRLAAIVRATPRWVAAFLVGRDTRRQPTATRQADDGERRSPGATRLQRALPSLARETRTAPHREQSDLPGRRSLSTTGRDRT